MEESYMALVEERKVVQHGVAEGVAQVEVPPKDHCDILLPPTSAQ
jgi:hypothetical protein